MDRLACVDVPALPLQILLRRRPDWRDRPVAVVDRARAQGRILWCSEVARRQGVRPGMRYGAGRSILRDLRADEVSEVEVEKGVATLLRHLRSFSPEVEGSDRCSGVFWLNASGLTPLYESLNQWIVRIRSGLEREGFQSRIAIGFTKFGTYAAVRSASARRFPVFDLPEQERAAVRAVSLCRLEIPPVLRDRLDRLGVRTVDDLLALPVSGLQERFGPEAGRLARRASESLRDLFQPQVEEEAFSEKMALEEPEMDLYRLLFLVKRLLHPILDRLGRRYRFLSALRLRLSFEEAGSVGRYDSIPRTTRFRERVETIRPAEPTRDPRQIMNLVHLRLESSGLDEGVTAIALQASATERVVEQTDLFARQDARDLRAADRALARLRAEFGEEAVVRAVLRDGHLPEARFGWEPFKKTGFPTPRDVSSRPLVRRVQRHPLPLPPRPRAKADDWMLKGEACGPALCFDGPYMISGGWWRRTVRRDYHYARMQNGAVFWIYYDRVRRRWFRQGEVE